MMTLARRATCAATFLTAASLASANLWAAPVHLRCNYQDQPLGIDTPQPTLSWQSDSRAQGWMQTAYRILVSSDAGVLRGGKGDVWDSGKVASSASVDIPYAGPALESRRRYFWTVQVWDNKGLMSASPQGAWWEMGLLNTSDWTARWISGADPGPQESTTLPWVWLGKEDGLKAAAGSVARFRYRLDLPATPMRATLAVVAHGELQVSVNGHATGHKKDWTAFDSEDIAEDLHAGANEILVAVTAPPARRRAGDGASDSPQTVIAAFSAQMTVTPPDGREVRVTSADGWEGSHGTTGDWSPVAIVGALDDPRLGTSPGLPAQPAKLLRQTFAVHGPIAGARLYVTAAGSYRMSINGRRVDETALTPDFTDYRKHIAYQTYDVTPLLVQGGNAIGAILGDGWYLSPMMWSGVHVFEGPTRLLAQLEVRYADGTHDTFATSPEWTVSGSPILSSTIYAGERYDARLEHRGWDTAGFDATAWKPAALASAPEGALTAQTGSPVHLAQTLRPKSIHPLANGDFVFDMGQNMVGWTTLAVTGPAGTRVRLRFAERLNPDGSIYTENLRNADAEDSYTLRGGGPEVFAPHFTFHGFQYVQVSGLPSKPTLDTLTGDVLNSLEDAPTGRLDTSSPLLNRMWSLGIWGQRGNFLSIATDCPQRDERMGWMGDAGVFWRTGSYNFDIAGFSRKYMQDIVDAQNAAGAFTDISPNLVGHATGAPGWGDAGIIVPYTAWLQYGDRTLVERSWPAMERWMDHIEKANPTYLREKDLGANYADWLAPDQNTPKDLVATAYWALVARMMREMAEATGHDASRYATLYDHVRDAYRKAYISAAGTVAGDTQTGYVLTLYTGMAPETLQAAMTEKLVANIKAHDGHLTTGFLGTPFLLFTLSDNGRTDVAYDLLMQETYPSWGYMISKGATTWWERWNGDSGDPAMNSYNHYSFGSVVAWIYRDTVGIDTAAAATGFQHLVIKPRYTTKLSFARGEYDSVYGTVKSGWTKTAPGAYSLKIVLPANTSATVYPDGEGGRAIEVGAGASEFQSQFFN